MMLVAGAGFEPSDLEFMRLTSYRAALPRASPPMFHKVRLDAIESIRLDSALMLTGKRLTG